MKKIAAAAALITVLFAALTATASPAMATFDFDYACSDGTSMSYSGPYNDMVIKLTSGALLQLPSAVPETYTGVFSAYQSPGAKCAVGSPLVPCAAYERISQLHGYYVVRDKLIQCVALPDQ